MANAERDAGMWPAQKKELEAEQTALEQSVGVLSEEARFLRAQAAPLEGRRRQLIALLHKLDNEPWVAGL